MLVNIDEKSEGGYMGFSTREKDGGKYAPQLVIHGELKEDAVVGTLQQEFKLTSVQDTFVQGGDSADKKYTTSSYMQVMSGTGALHRRTYLRFDVNQLGADTVNSATLQLHLKNANIATNGEDGHSLQALAFNADWGDTLTWNSQPDLTNAVKSPVTNFTVASKNKIIELDVTDIVNQLNGKQTLDLALINPVKGNTNLIAITPTEGSGDTNPAPTLILK